MRDHDWRGVPRSWVSVVFAMRQPSCSVPTRCACGEDVLEEDLVGLLAAIIVKRAHGDAGRLHVMGRSQYPSPGRRRISAAKDAPARNARNCRTFWPFTTQPSPRRSARVRSAVRSSAFAPKADADLLGRNLRIAFLLLGAVRDSVGPTGSPIAR
jgi:hypothetical protein